jgi:hypothetical protein
MEDGKMRFERTMRGVALAAAALLIAAAGPQAAQAKPKKAKTPPPPFFAVNPGEDILYLVPGYLNDTSDPDDVATVVTCINVGFPDPVQVRVEAWENPGTAPDAQVTATIDPGESQSFASQDVVYFPIPALLAPNFFVFEGTARVIQISPGKVICRAMQVLNPNSPDASLVSSRELPVIPFGGEAVAGAKKKK